MRPGVPRAQALVELALVLPVLLLLVLAAIDLGRIFFAQIAIANTAREGAYEASYGGSYVANAACSSTNSVMCAIVNEAQSSLTVAPTDVVRTCSGSGGCAAGSYGDVVTIKVTGHFNLLTPVLAVFFGGTNIAFSSSASADMVLTPAPVAGPGATATPTVAPTATVLPTASPFPTPSGLPVSSPTPSAPTCPAPVPNFTYTQQNKNKPVVLTSTYTPSSGSCQVTFWRWDYGAPDNGIDSGAVPTISHQFALEGQDYQVTLTITNPYGTAFIVKTVHTQP